jgi:HK97 family phage major capsid protein
MTITRTNITPLAVLRAQTRAHLKAVEDRLSWQSGPTQGFSIVELIRSKMQHTAFDERRVAASLELSDLCASASRRPPDGVWVPLAALTRDLTTTSLSSAVQPQRMYPELATAQLPGSVLMGNGATILGNLDAGMLSFPKFETGVDVSGAAWIGENAAAPQREPSFSAPRQMVPKTVSIEMFVARKLLLQSAVDVDAEMRAELSRRFYAEFDRVGLIGNGTLEPLGLLNDTAIQTLPAGLNGAAPTWDNIVDAEHAVSSVMRTMQAPAFLMSAALRRKLRKTQRGAGLDYILPGRTLLDHPVAASATVPSNLTKGSGTNLSAMVFGDLAEVLVGFWGPVGVDLLVDPYTYGTKGTIKLVARAEVGVVARQPAALVAYKDFITT